MAGRLNMLLRLASVACLVLAEPAAAQAPVAGAGENGVEVRRGATVLRIDALTDAVLRVRIGRVGAMPEDASWAVAAPIRRQRVAVTPTADGFRTARVAVRIDPATLGDNCEGLLYADDGHSTAYRRGVLLRQTMRCTRTAEGLRIDFDRREGSYRPWWKRMRVTVHGWTGAGRVAAGGRAVAVDADATGQLIAFTIPDQPRAATVTLTRR